MIDEKILIDELTMCMEKEKFKCDQMADLNLGEAIIKYSHGQYCYMNALHLVQSQPTVNEWIPVSERLPYKEINEYDDSLVTVLVTVVRSYGLFGDATYREIADYDVEHDVFVLGDMDNVKVVAWMPLPPAYEGK